MQREGRFDHAFLRRRFAVLGELASPHYHRAMVEPGEDWSWRYLGEVAFRLATL